MKDKELREIVNQLKHDVKRLEDKAYARNRADDNAEAKFNRLLTFLNVEEYYATTQSPDGSQTFTHIYRTKA